MKTWMRCLVVALAGLWIAARRDAFDPHTLYLDDQWVALLARSASLADLLRLDAPVPHGFVFLLKGAAALFGDASWVLQLVPMLCGAAQCVLIGWAGFRLTGDSFTGAAAALFAAIDPESAFATMRVKPFALDALITTFLLLCFIELLRGGGVRWWIALMVTAAIAPCFGFGVLISGGVIACAAAVVAARSRGIVVTGLVLCACVSVTYSSAVLVEQSSDALRDYWRGYYVPAAGFDTALRFASGALPGEEQGYSRWILLALLTLLAFRSRTSREARAITYVALAVTAAAVAASAASLYPLGGGRTDLYAHPLFHLLFALAVIAPPPRSALRAIGLGGLFAVYSLIAIFAPVPYPMRNDHEVVAKLAGEIAAEDALVIYPWSSWAVAYYGGFDSEFVKESSTTNGYLAIPKRDNALVLREKMSGVDYRLRSDVTRLQIDAWLRARPRPARIFYIATEVYAPPNEWILAALAQGGYSVEASYQCGAALFMRLRRPER